MIRSILIAGAGGFIGTILRHLTQPLAAMTANGEIPPESVVLAEVDRSGEQLLLSVAA